MRNRASNNHPLNVCPLCFSELEEAEDDWVCVKCGEKWPKTMMNVTKNNIENYHPGDKRLYDLWDRNGSHIITVLCYEVEVKSRMIKHRAYDSSIYKPTLKYDTR